MGDYRTYVFFLCLIVFALMTILSVVCVSVIATLEIRLIRAGAEDGKILRSQGKRREAKRIVKLLDYAFSGIVCLVVVAVFLASLAVGRGESQPVGELPVYRVVRTGSMAEVHEKNAYLHAAGIDDRIQIFDLIRTEKLPDEMELELYDVVVYETDGMMIVHRIVEIEEPNAAHPDCRHFRLQGDAVEAPDRFPVLYEQMRALYSGQRIPYVGSFILFMQSPAGWLCIGLIVFAMIATPLLEAKLRKEREWRLLLYPLPGSDKEGRS
ncbi:MAG: hypothetical protein IJF73_00805 [Clostridia bacterium]|nr:hypothetical protein [Clostridia bacterium]